MAEDRSYEPITDRDLQIQNDVVGMYSAHPSPSRVDKLAFADRRMGLRLFCCGVSHEDFVGKDVLDAGCGTGEYSAWFAAQGARVRGIDLSDGSLEEARAYAERHGISNASFEKRSVLSTGLDNESFDLIYCTGVLHHTPRPLEGIHELARLLRPGGKLIVSLYSMTGFAPREVRRRIARRLGGSDLDCRVAWGKRLFPFTYRRLARGDRYDEGSALFDYFAIPHETLHLAGQLVNWIENAGLNYTGSFPAISVRDYPRMFSSDHYQKVESHYQYRVVRALAKLRLKHRQDWHRPGMLSRASSQALWLLFRVEVFCIAGQKPESPHIFASS